MSLQNKIKRLSDISEEQLEKLVVTYKNIAIARKFEKESEGELQAKFRRVMEITLFGWKSEKRIDSEFANELYEKLRIVNAFETTVKKIMEKDSEESQT